MPWSIKATNDPTEPAGWNKNLEPLGYPLCTCGNHTWGHLKKGLDDEILKRVRTWLLSEDGYNAGHYSNRICKGQPIYPDKPNVATRTAMDKQISELTNQVHQLKKQAENKDAYIDELEKKLLKQRDLNSQQQLDISRMKEILDNAKNSMDNAQKMLNDTIVGSLNEAPHALELLSLQLLGIYAVLEGNL
jgi:hypothetical protein